jgi:exoribonuclease R
MIDDNNMKILIHDRSYTDYTIYDSTDNVKLSISEITPSKYKMFNEDIFTYNDSNKSIEVSHSVVKNAKNLCGVLMLDSNKTFGRTENKKRLLYKCVPYDKHLPIFLIPYDVKIGFIKKNKNKLILFRFDDWCVSSSHPKGIITETIGDVSDIDALYEYHLYSNNLHYSMKEFTNETKKRMKESFIRFPERSEEHECLVCPSLRSGKLEKIKENSLFIFTIDPHGSVDYDDCISVCKEDDLLCLRVYITNVFLICDSLFLWDFLTDRVSTVYLPKSRKCMLPSVLSENYCSLKEGVERSVFIVSFYFDEKRNAIKSKTEIKTGMIKVNKNFAYEEPELLNDSNYKELLQLTKCQEKDVSNSRDVIKYWMIHTNKVCSEFLLQRKIGIFRTCSIVPSVSILHNLNPMSENALLGEYVEYNENLINPYCHFTSPIRRIVDIVNQLLVYTQLFPYSMSKSGELFFQKWMNNIKFINESMKSVKKVQNQCRILDMYFGDKMISERIINVGVIFNKSFNSEKCLFTYDVYLHDMKVFSKVTTVENIDNNSEHKFEIFLFENEEKTKKKLKLAFYVSDKC